LSPERHNAAGLLWSAAAAHGSRPAVVDRDRTVSYDELRNRAAALAGRLADAGVVPGDRIAILLERGADAAAASCAALAIGGVLVTLNEGLRPRQIEHILDDSAAAAFLTTADLLARQPRPIATRARTVLIEAARGNADYEPVLRDRDDLAQITYTSGSTGRPKGVMLSHGNLRAVTATVTAYLGLSPEDRIGSLLPFSFVYGFNQLLCALGTGAALVVERSPLPQQIAATLRHQAVTVLAAVPPLWTQLLSAPGFRDEPLPALRVMTNAGGRLPVDTVRALRAAQPRARLFLMYGLTEAMRSTYLDPGEVDRRPDSIGRAIPGAEIAVLRDDLTPCDDDEVGELVHRGPTVGLGYWRDPETTARVFRAEGVLSGDLVRRDAEGFLYFVGRKDRMIKTLGYRVSPDEVAEVLLASGQVAEAVVTAEADPNRGQRIVAHVVLHDTASLEGLRGFCEVELPRYMQPGRFATYDALPRTPAGKYDLTLLGGNGP
jgi:amino acid adenylation domain-containing protein